MNFFILESANFINK